MQNITFQYPAWYLIFCVLLGLAYALILYYRSKDFGEHAPAWLTWGLGILRFLAVTLLSALLLSPLLKSLLTETKKPVVVLAQDVSESVVANMDEATQTAYRTAFQNLQNQLAEQYEVQAYSFGNEVRQGIDFQYTDKVSNVSSMLRELYDLYSNQNLGAVVLATDGIYNEGSNPIYAGTKLTAPIYTIALGDTTAKKDVILKRVFHNKIAYLGDKFSIQMDVSAVNYAGKNTTLTISKVENGQTRRLQQIPININKNDFFTTQEVILDADVAGVQRYRVTVGGFEDEVTRQNNSKDIFVDVLDARQKILLLANSPHPDLAAIKATIQSNKNYEVTTNYANNMQVNLADFDFVILHQLPSKTNDITSIVNQLNTRNTPRLFVVGSQSNLSQLNSYQKVLSIQGDGRNTNDVSANVVNGFSLFTLNDKIRQDLPNFAPMTAPFGEFKAGGNASILLHQRIGKVDTQYPLLVLGEENGTKTGVLAGEGFWRWRLFDYLQNSNHEITDELMGKTIQFLTLKEDKRRFRISQPKTIFNENEAVTFDAELYNQNFELVNEPDASLVLTNDDGRDFNFTFNKAGNAYTLSAGILPVGNYRYTGNVFANGENLKYNGQFSVQPVQLEAFNTTADHGLLRLLAQEYGGEMVYPSNLAALATTLTTKDIKPVLYQTTKTRSIINLKWIFFLILGLLSLEWFGRRYHGAY